MTITDAHTHLLPGRFAQRVREFFEAHLAGPLVYPLEHEAVLEQLHAEGVGQVWSFPYAHRPGVARAMNEASAETVQRFARGPVRVVAGATVHPGDDDPASLVIEALDTFGLKVLKLHCSVGAFRLDDPRLTPVWEVAAVRRLPVVVHLGKAVSGHTAGTDLDELRRVLAAHEGVRIVLAHCGHGAGPDTWALLRRHANLHADLAPVVAEPVVWPARDLGAIAPKLLFGSDAPNTAVRAGAELARVRGQGLSPTDEQGILGLTAARLIAEVKA